MRLSPSTCVSITVSVTVIQFRKSMYPSSHPIRIPAPRGRMAAVTLGTDTCRTGLAAGTETDCVDHWDLCTRIQWDPSCGSHLQTVEMDMCVSVCASVCVRGWGEDCGRNL